jgi:hypothetical protein
VGRGEDGGQAIEQSRALQVVQAWGLLHNALQELRSDRDDGERTENPVAQQIPLQGQGVGVGIIQGHRRTSIA